MDVEVERELLLARDAQWAKLASEGGDIDEILSYWTDNAVVIPAGMPSLAGREALRAYVEGTRTIPGFRISWSSTEAQVSSDGTMAYLLSTNEVAMNGPDGQPVTTRGRAVTVWQRDAQGQWRCAVDIWNDLPE
jgi:ketosteroid isomerase-like protein